MYYYAEVLRGRRALRVIAIILGVFLLIAILLRLWAFAEHGPTFIASSLQTSPTAHVSSRTLADGTVETTVVDRVENVHAVIDRRSGYFHIDAMVPSNRKMAGTFSFGDSAVTVDKKTGMKHVVMTEDLHGANLPVGILFAVASVFALVTATMLGGVLAKENDGHLELAWTKPVSRERLAVASIATDIATILTSQLFAVAVILIICAMFVWPKFYANAQTAPVLVLALLGPVAWYSCLTAASASLKRGLGMVCGLGWLAALMIPAVATGTKGSQSDLGRSIHFVFQSLTYFDPIAYMSLHGGFNRAGIAFATAVGTLGFSVVALAVLTVVYLALSVLQWRRVEA